MNLYQGYCYSSIEEAADAEISSASSLSVSGAAVPVSYVVVGSTVTLSINTSSGTSYNLIRTYPECASVGYQHNFTGLSVSDVTESSWLVLLVWASVWAIKSLRRGL